MHHVNGVAALSVGAGVKMKHTLLTSFAVVLLAGPITQAIADAPQPIMFQTRIVFAPEAEGTFTASPPLCASGITRALREVRNPSLMFGHGFTVLAQFVCDDNSGTFVVQYHPQAGSNYAGGTRNPAFDVSGPWSIVNGSTGRYSELTGHGDFGVLIDFDADPWTGEESFVGFVQLK